MPAPPDRGTARGPAAARPGPPPDPAWQAVAALFAGTAPPADDARDLLPPALAERLAATDPRRRETEYVRLFVNAVPGVPCPPYASVHLEGTLHGTATARVRALYRRWGVDSDEVPDHFAVEAAFVAGLLAAARPGHDGPGDADPDAGRAAAVRDLAWLRDHLRGWAPRFLARVEEEDRTGVYREAARWARALLHDLDAPAGA